MRRFLIALLLIPSLALAGAPKPYSADYEVRRNGEVLGKATITFSARGGGQYEFASSTRGTGGMAALAGVSIDEKSTLRWVGERPETIDYSLRQKVAWKTRERNVHVDAGAGRVLSSEKGNTTPMPYQAGVLDRNAISVALMQDLIAQKKGDLVYPVVDRTGIGSQRYRQGAVETLATALGRQRVIRVERIRESSEGRTTTLWFGVDKAYVPLQILQREADGETIEMRVTAIR